MTVPSAPPPPTLKVHYIKSQLFRAIHVDGIIGGPTPGGNIHFALFSERPAIPQEMDLVLGSDGQFTEGPRRGKEGFVRELEIDAHMSIDTARKLHEWLGNAVANAEKLFVPPAVAPQLVEK